MKKRVAIIGAGRIASGFDEPDSTHVLTHAHAFSRDPRTELIGIHDIDTKVGESAAKKWGATFYADLEKMLKERPDIVVIASPDETHAHMLIQVAAHKPAVIVCEKPPALTRGDIQRLKGDLGVPVIVNFSRRFDTTVQKMRKSLSGVVSATGTYTGGLLHNGCHMVDLGRFLFGEMQPIGVEGAIGDRAGDPSIGATLRGERCPLFRLVPAGRVAAIFELDILTEKKRVRFIDEGRIVVEQDIIADPLFSGYKAFGEERRSKTELENALPALVDAALATIEGGESPSPLSEALKTMETCLSLVEAVK